MLATNIIAAKRDGKSLSRAEIEFMIGGLIDGTIPDYQIAAWAMAIVCRAFTPAETAALTEVMLHSGQQLKRQSERLRLDKHSTGGLGDKTSLILAPLLACFNVEVPMLSGRGLGITGGTLDKLESYAGYRCDLSAAEIDQRLADIGCVITGTTPDIAPADKRLYALRDVTATVPAPGLITSSILSKKLAETLDALVLDVKFGSGSFMPDLSQAAELASTLKRTATELGLKVAVCLSSMQQPLGSMVGNACEVNEAVDVLRGKGPDDLRELTLHLASRVLSLAGLGPAQETYASSARYLEDGQALERYQAMIEGQGGTYREHLETEAAVPVLAEQSGWIREFDGVKLGEAMIRLGGGRRMAGDSVNHAVGFERFVGIGDPVELGQPVGQLFVDDRVKQEQALATLAGFLHITEEPGPEFSLIPSVQQLPA